MHYPIPYPQRTDVSESVSVVKPFTAPAHALIFAGYEWTVKVWDSVTV